MAKIGVMTFHRASNYGAVLQAFALQSVLTKLGHDSNVLDYRSRFIEQHYDPRALRTLKSPKRIATAVLRNGYQRYRRDIFDSFRMQHLPMSACLEAGDLGAATQGYDVLVAGSDQVWNYQTAGFDENYFLSFAPAHVRRTAYAASIGISELPIDYVERYRTLLSEFTTITMREETGAAALRGVLGYTPKTVLDPTLLLPQDEWIAHFGEKKKSSPYILMYLLAETPGLIQYARRLSRATGMEVRYVTHRLFRPPRMTILDSSGPASFVREMLGASALVTNSFHGIAFALNFGLDLHYDLLPSSSPVNSRITDLTKNFGLQDRRIGRELLPARSLQSVLGAAEKLAQERERSIKLLEEMVSLT
jgi:hypothetical protein